MGRDEPEVYGAPNGLRRPTETEDDVQWGVESHPFSRSIGICSRAGNGANELRRLSVPRHLHDAVRGELRRERGRWRQGKGASSCVLRLVLYHRHSAEGRREGAGGEGGVSDGRRSRLDSCRPRTLLTHVKDLPNGTNKERER